MTDAPGIAKFREECRQWLRQRTPEALATHRDRGAIAWGGRKSRFSDPAVARWFLKVTERGWAAPQWSTEHGGAGLDAERAAVVREELVAAGCGGLLRNFGTQMLGPLILNHGTEEQKRRHLPSIARGRIRWCLGFSEPNAGSDLAGLQCQAVRDGDHYVVSGEKIWNSFAHESDFMELLVRTDKAAPKHEGISVLLVDLSLPGVAVTPIELISGKSHFCSTVLEKVRVPVCERLGAENEGWKIVQEGLRYERQAVVAMTMADGGFTGRRRTSLVDLARTASGCKSGPLPGDIAASIAALEIEQLAFRACERRAGVTDGARPAPHPSELKFAGARLAQKRRALEMDLRGFDGLGWEGEGFEEEALRAAREWLRAFGLSIEGGTSEIQLNIIARRVLQLPR